MKKSLIIFLTFLLSTSNLYAKYNGANGGFYSGVDAAKNNEKIGQIDNSVVAKTEDDHYYGYKFSGAGFFLSPEVFSEKANQTLTTQSTSSTSNATSNSKKTTDTTATTNTNYGLKANIGYDFNRHFSGFVTYDVAKFSYNAGQSAVVTGANSNLNNSTIGIGSQINFSDSFGVKILYNQQQFGSRSVSGGKVTSDVIKFGTVYSF
jgi:hypothetical protein